MKIGYLLQSGAPEVRQPPYSGPANHVRQVVKGLLQKGHEVRLIAQYNGEIWATDDLEHFHPIYESSSDQSAMKTFERSIRKVQAALHLPYAALFESLQFARICKDQLSGFDVLFERTGWFGYGGGLAAYRLGIPLVLEINGDLLAEHELLGMAPRGAQRWISSRLFERNARKASGYVATGEGWRRRFAEQWGVPRNQITIVENGTEIVQLLERNELRCFQADREPDRPVSLVFVGGFDPWQGLDVLLHAFARAIQQCPSLHLSLVGDGAGSSAIKQMIKGYHLSKNVALYGWLSLPEVSRILAGSDIGVSPYHGRSEYSGLKLYDYKAAGLAVIASGMDGEPKSLEHGKTGWVVPPGDVEALAGAILRLAGNPLLRRNLGQAARLDAEQNHTWQHAVEKLETVLSQAAGI